MTTSNITVQTLNNQLVVDSRLIAKILDIKHKSFLETIRKYETIIQQVFGQLNFKKEAVKGNNGGGRPKVFYYLNEEQACFLMTLSRNRAEVKKAKTDIIKNLFEATKISDKRDILTEQMFLEIQKIIDAKT